MSSDKHKKMVTGYNHNVKHKGRIYHVQTEDSGVQNPHIITHLFVGGNILATKKTSYADIVNAENLEQIVRELMQEQHKAMLRNLVNGVYDDIDTGEQPPAPAAVAVSTSTRPSVTAQPTAAATSKPVHPGPPKTPALQPASVPVPVPPSTAGPATAPPTLAAAPETRPSQPTAAPGKFPLPRTPPPRTEISIPRHEMPTQPVLPAVFPPGVNPSSTMAVDTVPAPPARPQVTLRAAPVQQTAGKRPLPPEVLAARELAEKPRQQKVPGPTIFGEDLVSEKSLDEVILSYLAGEEPGER